MPITDSFGIGTAPGSASFSDSAPEDHGGETFTRVGDGPAHHVQTNEGDQSIITNTAHNAFGPVAPANITADTLVTVNGMQTTAAVAESLGLLTRNPITGLYVSTGNQLAEDAPRQQQQQRQAPQQGNADRLDVRTERTIADVAAKVSPTTQASAAVEVFETGEISPAALQALASELGVDPSQASEMAEGIRASFEAQAGRAVAKASGADPEAVFAWAHENAPDALRRAMEKQFYHRDTSGYAALARSYTQSMGEADPEAVLNAEFGSGITAHRHGSTVVLSIPGYGQMSYRDALRHGIIRVS